MAVGKFSELGRVGAIRELFKGSGFKAFEEPCTFDVGKGRVVLASKLFLEGIDFNLKYFPFVHLGYKCVAIVSGELYSKMARSRSLSIVIGVSSKLDYEEISQLWNGMTAAAREHGYSHVSLELNPSLTGLSISVSATGVSEANPGQAKSKDLICVTGRLGAAYLGEQVLEKKFDSIGQYKMMVGACLKPEISPDFVDRMEKCEIIPSWACLVEKGLSDAVLRLSRDTSLGAKIYADKIPFEGNSFSLSKELGIDPVSAAMNGGDDNVLMFVIPIECAEKFRHDFQTFEIIGHMALPEVGAVLVTPEGVELPLRSQGWKEEG